ncbi:MAG: hypothetical protein FJ100_10545 [Deltaproteobacteria bacterium]|nr:hypothetical protein [Deltaproteobacteria bacterium]
MSLQSLHAYCAAAATIAALVLSNQARAQSDPSPAALPVAPSAVDAPAAATAEMHPSVETPTAVEPKAAPDEPHSAWHWRHSLDQRFVGERASVVEGLGPEASEAARLGPTSGMQARARAGTQVSYASPDGFFRHAVGELQVQLRYWDQPWAPLPATHNALLRGRVELTTTAGQFTLGRSASVWGLGLLATDGGYDALQFGARQGENAVTRLGWAVLPASLWHKGDPLEAFPLAVAVAYDVQAHDDLARLPGDAATNQIAAILYRGKQVQTGAYAVRRAQTDADGLGLAATVVDGFVRYRRQTGLGWVEIAAEGLYGWGHTGWLKSPNQPDGLDLAQWGGAARVEVGRRRGALRFEAGGASADALPLNGTLRSFRFATDYHVGLVMFGQAQRQLSAQAAHNLADPRYSGSAPAGVQRVATWGAVTQALYVHPVVRLQPYKNVAVLLGGVWAQSPADVADPFRTFLNGGKATGPRGAQGKRGLGTELDGAVECTAHLLDGLVAVARVDAGVWFPGDAYDDAAGGAMAAVGVVQGQVQVRADF